jgi:aerobic carbon-monoxide dehydrogenase small subunit
MAARVVTFTLNGQEKDVLVKPLTTLQTVLREQLGQTATKIGCKQGGCGSCTVIVNGKAMLSCLLPAEDVAGQEVVTVEGLASVDSLHPIQQAFFDHYAIQCGYCSPGMIMAVKALLDENPTPTRDEIIEAISGNLCRCTGYVPIIKAVEAVAAGQNGGKNGSK